jgi:hypothetical protein
MTKDNIDLAIAILLEHHSNKISINKLPNDSSSVSDAAPIVIHKCVPSVIDKLIKNDFSLSMSTRFGGLLVNHYNFSKSKNQN